MSTLVYVCALKRSPAAPVPKGILGSRASAARIARTSSTAPLMRNRPSVSRKFALMCAHSR